MKSLELQEKRAIASIPMRRIGEPREIAAAIAFLLSEDAGFITGQTLHVDGGSSLPYSGDFAHAD